MPNWCTNSVSFYGGDLKGLKESLIQGIKVNNESNVGWLPDYLQETGQQYLFDINITIGEKDRLYMNCDTKWSPCNDELIAIADKHGCGFVNCYEEMGMGIYGEFTYEDGSSTDIYLTDDEINQVKYDIDTDLYTYKGETSESSYQFYEALLDIKKEKYNKDLTNLKR